MTEENKDRMLDLLDAFCVAGNGNNLKAANALKDLLRSNRSPEDIFTSIFMDIDELNESLDDCGYAQV